MAGRSGAGTELAAIDGVAWYPRFSPDGTRIAFGVAQGEANNTEADIWGWMWSAEHKHDLRLVAATIGSIQSGHRTAPRSRMARGRLQKIG